ncbi:hypothetical protein [Citrobacter freundii]|uniref:Uncharacterized protein n=1 Tax=Citrobacter freundii TaxID=546 RepID=A0A7G2IIR3_CITFR|nr:hypothetical protein [Citrobacter freundii]
MLKSALKMEKKTQSVPGLMLPATKRVRTIHIPVSNRKLREHSYD